MAHKRAVERTARRKAKAARAEKGGQQGDKRREQRMKEAAEKSEDFRWSLNRISLIVNWGKLVGLVSICPTGHARDGRDTAVGDVAPGRKAAGGAGVLPGHTPPR